jgi:AcrR family transcriptional regulator
MKKDKKTLKEANIITAAEKVFMEVGFKNAKMDDIAREAGITKVTLYSYFQSKENLYLALTYRALQLLIERYYESIERYNSQSGLESSLSLFETFMSFCEDHYLYSEALLEYFSLVRATASGTNDARLTDAEKDSLYYQKLQEIQNLPFKLTVREIERGKKDGSIVSNIDPMLSTLYGWTMVVGYVKVISASGTNASPLFNVSLKELKNLNLALARHMFLTPEI